MVKVVVVVVILDRWYRKLSVICLVYKIDWVWLVIWSIILFGVNWFLFLRIMLILSFGLVWRKVLCVSLMLVRMLGLCVVIIVLVVVVDEIVVWVVMFLVWF